LLIFTIVPVFVLFCAWILGTVAIGQEVGTRLMRAFNQTWQPILATALGTFLFMLVSSALGLIPCAGWLFNLILTLVAIGAVMMTRFGTRSGPGPVTIVATETPTA